MSFNPTYSTDEIYIGEDFEACLTDELNELDTGKAPTNHTHTPASIGAAAAQHTHDYAESSHTHSYNDLTDRPTIPAAYTHPATHPASMITGLSAVATSGSYNDLGDKPTIPTIPSSLPANGGNADTVDNKHASDFAVANHTHDYAASSHTHAQADITGLASALSGKAASYHTHAQSDVSGLASALAGKAASSHTHAQSDVTGLESALAGKAAASHIHGTTPVTADADLNDYNVAGVYSFAAAYQPVNRPAGTSNGWLVVIPWTSNTGTQTIKQFWLRHGSLGTNDHNVYVRTKIGDYGWSEWAKFFTSKDMTITKENGDVYVSWTGQDVVAKICALAPGMYTAYSRGGSAGTTNAPNSTEGFRYLVHKTGEDTTNYGWAMAFGTSGSVYAGYYDSGTWRGWRSLYTAIPDVLWSGASYLKDTQTVTPSKKLSECNHGWLLLWSDYDPDNTTANDADFETTVIPKWHPSGSTWSGKMFLCDVPRYYGSDTSNVDTEKRIMKAVYIHDDKIVGHTINNLSTRTDVVLRAVYEW